MRRLNFIKMDSVLDGISGETTIHYFRDGLLTKYADILISKNIRTDEAIFLPGIRLIVTLLGKTELRFSDKMFCLTAEKYPAAGLLSISKEISGSKYFSGKKQQELVIFLEEDWLKSSGFNQCMDYAFLQKIQKSNLEFIPLFANKKILTLVNSLIRSEQHSPTLSHMQKESDCLALVVELLSQLREFNQVLSPEQKRAYQLTQLLLSGEADDWTLAEIAKYMHTNVTSLQTDFKQVHNISIMKYLRQIKLERAYKALLQGVSVNKAAEIAGYTNPDNFSTAFRRYFSIAPSSVKKINYSG